MTEPLLTFWTMPAPQLLEQLGSGPQGLSSAQAAAALARHGPNTLRPPPRFGGLRLLLKQVQSPITLILIAAAILALALGDRTNAVIILAIVVVSSVLGFWQERGAAHAVAKLLAVVQTKATLLRDGSAVDLPVAEVVPGDVVRLAAGATIPGDCLLLESQDLFVDEAALTGETYPVEKHAGVLPADTTLALRANLLFKGRNTSGEPEVNPIATSELDKASM